VSQPVAVRLETEAQMQAVLGRCNVLDGSGFQSALAEVPLR
jgi:hypothetical protein